MHDTVAVTAKLLEALRARGESAPPLRLVEAVSGPTGVSTAGFPYVTRRAFQVFLDGVPHLHRRGQDTLAVLGKIETAREGAGLSSSELHHLTASLSVFRNVVRTAGVTAPPDLWVVRYVLAAHARAGITAHLAAGGTIDDQWIAARRIDARQLGIDLALLSSRGYLARRGEAWTLDRSRPQAVSVYAHELGALPTSETDLVTPLVAVLTGATRDLGPGRDLLGNPVPAAAAPVGWIADYADIEIAFRIVPLVIALHASGLGSAGAFEVGACLRLPTVLAEAARPWLHAAGIVDKDDTVTELGARVLGRGPGPFGIIHAYYPYMGRLDELLHGRASPSHVARGANVAASQDANRKTFRMANDALDRFCARHGFSYQVYIEHAVGRGEATRQRFLKDREQVLRYVGADLEDAAIEAAEADQRAGRLPANMRFIRNADIGRPAALLDGLTRLGLNAQGAVMIVGNGFHEVRGQTNEQMQAVFRAYCDAGLVLIFTEESALSDEDLRATGWNTYHAGFRYVHELSGQGLRPATDADDVPGARASWERCATMGGYEVLPEYTTRTRTIYPHPGPDGHNPAISVTYFCVPRSLWRKLKKGS